MQHLDEGTIHSWLDGALSADEATQVKAHVKECPQCASTVAEARGFIAASSRILTALDAAPRGVMPVAAPRKRVDPLVWRVAATVLVVAAGTLVVVQNRGGNENLNSVSADSASASSQPISATERLPAVAEQATVPANEASPKSTVSNAPTIAPSRKAGTERSRSDVVARENRALAEGPTARAGQTAAASNMAGAAAAPTALTSAASRVAAVAAVDAATEREPFKVVGTPQRIGAKVTLYEVAPGDTVTLTESMPISLNSIVLRGPVTPMARRATEKSAAAPSKTGADAAAAPAPPQREMANTVHTVIWTDPATGNTLSLTGRMPEARLQEIRIRIDRERAAAAKKNP